MLKTSYNELKMWVGEDGSLNVTIGDKTVSVPHEEATELISIMDQKQRIYQEKTWRSKTVWERLCINL